MKSLTTTVRALFKHLTYGPRIQPSRDWLFLLAMSAVLLAGSVLWNLWLFSRLTEGKSIGPDASTPAAEALNLDGVRTLFGERSAERARYVEQYRFVDPSL